MSKAKKKSKFDLAKIFRKKKSKAVTYLLEKSNLADMKAAREWTEKLLDYHWKFYFELAYQRNQNSEKIKDALNESCISNFEFSDWQRAVKYKYSLHPLCTAGSITFIGGRFNTGRDINSQIPEFQCLYVTIDKDTALQETLGQEPPKNKNLSPQEMALSNPQSETIVAVRGRLDKVIDLRKPKNLKKLIAVLKTFKLSKEIKRLAKEANLDEPMIIKTEKALLDTVLEGHWRDKPVNFDIPANSQIFGYLVFLAGIDGIIYPSKLTKKDCLAIFPKNFENGESFVELTDEPPNEKVPRRIDASNWKISEATSDELSNDTGIMH
jgi:hypothetical protein